MLILHIKLREFNYYKKYGDKMIKIILFSKFNFILNSLILILFLIFFLIFYFSSPAIPKSSKQILQKHKEKNKQVNGGLDSEKIKELKKDEKLTVAKIDLSEYLSLPITERFIYLYLFYLYLSL